MSNVNTGSNIRDVDSLVKIPIYCWPGVWSPADPHGTDLIASVVFWRPIEQKSALTFFPSRLSHFHTVVFHCQSGKIGAEMSTTGTPEILTTWSHSAQKFSGRWFIRRVAGFLLHTGCPTGSDLMDEPSPLPSLSAGEAEIRGISLIPSDAELEVMNILDEPSPVWWRTDLAFDFFRNSSKVCG